MVMNLKPLFEMQKVLDYRIEQEHPRQEGEDRLAKKLLALQVELGECANEWRGFKFWSNNQKPSKIIHTTQGATTENAVFYHCADDECGERFYKDDKRLNDLFGKNEEDCPTCKDGYLNAFREKNPLLEEFVDVLHFSISIAIELGLTTYKVTNLDDLRYHKNSVIKTFSMVYRDINELQYYENADRYIRDFLDGVLGLGYKLGFTFEEIEQAYISKNQTNHSRQNNGY